MRPGDLLGAQRGPLPPASLQGTLVMPFTGGGVNWGGLAVDSAKGVVYVDSSNMLHRITLSRPPITPKMKKRFHDKEVSPQRAAPYGMMRELLVSPLGLPCNPRPWGVLTALDLGSRKILSAGTARHDRGTQPAGPRPPRRHADLRWPARHRERPRLHRRRARRLSARFRREDSRRALDRPPTLSRHRDPDQLSLAGPPICRDRRRRPWRSGAPAGDTWSPSPAPPRRVRAFALVRLARPAGRALQAACRHCGSRRARAGGAVAAAAAKASPAAGLSS